MLEADKTMAKQLELKTLQQKRQQQTSPRSDHHQQQQHFEPIVDTLEVCDKAAAR